MEKKNGKGKKRKIIGMVCLILILLFTGTLVSAYSIFKTKFYDKSNYVKRGTYLAVNQEKDAEKGAKDTTELQAAPFETVTHSTVQAQKIYAAAQNGNAAAAGSHSPETEQETSYVNINVTSGKNAGQDAAETEEENTFTRLAKQFFSKKDTYNILLLGVDRRDQSWNGNSDVVLLVTVNKEKKTVYLTSFLRDLYADIPGIGVRKLNAACANGGPELAVETLEENYHVEVDNYAMVDFNAMIDVIDALGGIDLEIDEDERVTANDYITSMCKENGDNPENYLIKKAGLVHLNGYQTVGYVRNRYTGKGSDFGRTQRQRNVLTAIADKARNGDFSSLSDTIESVMPYITHDITEFEMIGLMMQVGTWLDYDIQEQHIPYDGEYTSQNEILVPTDMDATIEKLTSILYGDGEIETETETETDTDMETDTETETRGREMEALTE